MRLLCVALAIAGIIVVAQPVGAWDCKQGVPDTPENQQAGLCVERHHKKHTETPVATATAAPTQTPVPTVTLAPTQAVATSTPLPGVPQRLAEVCHYEASTGMWEIRHVTSGNERVEQGDRWPMGGICQQDTPVPVQIPATQTPVPPAVQTVVPPTMVEQPPAVEQPPEVAQQLPPAVAPCVPADMWPVPGDTEQLLDEHGWPVWINEAGEVVVGVVCEEIPSVPAPAQIPG